MLKFCVKFLKNPIKLLASPFPMMLQTILLEGHLKGDWALEDHSNDTCRALGRSKGTKGIRRSLRGYSNGTLALKTLRCLFNWKALGHSGTLSLGHSKGTQHSRDLSAQGTLFCRLLFNAICPLINAVVFFKMHYTFILCEFMDLYSFNIRFI